jgi:putative polyketide hydroxylase
VGALTVEQALLRVGDRAGVTSTLDLVRDGRYLLLTGTRGHPWARAAREPDPSGAFLDVVPPPRQVLGGWSR